MIICNSVANREDLIRKQLIPVEDVESLKQEKFGASKNNVDLYLNSYSKVIGEYYHTQYWQHFSLSNGGFFTAPESNDCAVSLSLLNGWKGNLTGEAYGVLICLLTYRSLRDTLTMVNMDAHYRHLLTYAKHLPEREMLISAVM